MEDHQQWRVKVDLACSERQLEFGLANRDLLTTAGSARIVFNGLVGLVENELHQQVESGDLFLFFNRRGDRVKVTLVCG